MNERGIIENAIPILENGWGRGSLYDKTNNCYCVIGALAKASGVFDQETIADDGRNDIVYSAADGDVNGETFRPFASAVEKLASVIQDRTGDSFPDSPVHVTYKFNDHDARDVQEVIEMLRGALDVLP